MCQTHDQWLNLHTITATHCCICRAALTDAVSVEKGIGPICGRKYYAIEHEITPAMVEVALGVIACSKLDNSVKLTAKHMKDRPREFCNILLKWASAHYDERAVVFDVADAVEALGFVELAAKLREDRTQVHVRPDATDPNRITVHTSNSFMFNRTVRRIPGCQTAPKVGRYEGFSVPKAHENVLMLVLAFNFGGKWATLMGKTGQLKSCGYYDVQQALDALYRPAPKAPPVQMPLPVVTAPPKSQGGIFREVGDKLEVFTPGYNGGFVADFKALLPYNKREWNPNRRCWTCPLSAKADVTLLVVKYFQVNP